MSIVAFSWSNLLVCTYFASMFLFDGLFEPMNLCVAVQVFGLCHDFSVWCYLIFSGLFCFIISWHNWWCNVAVSLLYLHHWLLACRGFGLLYDASFPCKRDIFNTFILYRFILVFYTDGICWCFQWELDENLGISGKKRFGSSRQCFSQVWGILII